MKNTTAISKERFINNLVNLVSESNKKIGEIENTIGVSQGYLSKLSRTDNKQWPSIETIAKLAEEFRVSIDELLFSTELGMSKARKKLHDFVNILTKNTEDDEMRWETEEYDQILANNQEYSNIDYHPVFDLNNGQIVERGDFANGLEFIKHPLRNSLFMGERFYLYGNCYKAEISDSEDIYLFRAVSSEDIDPDGSFSVYYVLMMHGKQYGERPDFTEVLEMENERIISIEERDGSLQWLYEVVNNHYSGLRFSKDAEDSISQFLANHKNRF